MEVAKLKISQVLTVPWETFWEAAYLCSSMTRTCVSQLDGLVDKGQTHMQQSSLGCAMP
jgi:hypothetical protein